MILILGSVTLIDKGDVLLWVMVEYLNLWYYWILSVRLIKKCFYFKNVYYFLTHYWILIVDKFLKMQLQSLSNNLIDEAAVYGVESCENVIFKTVVYGSTPAYGWAMW